MRTSRLTLAKRSPPWSRRAAIALAGLAALGGCHEPLTVQSDAPRRADGSPDAIPIDGHPDAAPDAAPDAVPIDAAPQPPMTLAETGLCADPSCATINPGILAYDLRWPLWSDGATKRRFLALPAGAQIDTSAMDAWQFPVGTRAWKEFSVGGQKLETRYVERIGPGPHDYLYMSYQWSQAGDAAVAVPAGVTDANGTGHDIPNIGQCAYCHEGSAGRFIGVAALELDAAAPGAPSVLDDLIKAGRLTNPPATPASGAPPYFPLGGLGAQLVQDALGYLHANCGHCHNPISSVHFATPLTLRLSVATLADPAATAAYQTAVGVAGAPVLGLSTIVVAKDPDHSLMIARMNATDAALHMPILGTKVVDPDGQTVLRAWISGLP